MEDNPIVSVIIPTKNSSKALIACLEALKNQDYKKSEIIVVDNYSTDNTVEIAKRYTSSIYTLGPERSAQINFGVEKASGKYIYRVDSDFVLEPQIIREAVKAAESNNYAAILIHNTSDPSVSFWARVRKFERDMYESEDLNVAVRFIRRDIFLSLGGYDPDLIYGEDYDLHNRIIQKYKIGRISPKETHLGEYKSLFEIAKKNYYYGKSASRFLRKNKLRGTKQVNPFRSTYFKNLDKFGQEPILAVGFIVYQIVRYGTGMLGLLASLIVSLPSRSRRNT
jgi:glycosyltransferase involved in cell wall biosynthesis